MKKGKEGKKTIGNTMRISNIGLALSNLKTQDRDLQQSESTERETKRNKIEQKVSSGMGNSVNGFPIIKGYLQSDSSKGVE
jgi:hypothetical protein